jgi:hypothetical protein
MDGGERWTSVYIRMEAIRRWVCGFAYIAFVVSQSTDVADALFRLEQDFQIRKIKSCLAGIAILLQRSGSITNSKSAAEEIASLAVDWLRQFDEVFKSQIGNKCGCQIGGKKLEIDFNTLMADLNRFYVNFSIQVQNCDVNGFLQMNRPNGRAAKLLQDEKVCKLTVGEKLIKLQSEGKQISCKECSWIGDAVIALEQPSTVNLVHGDASFNELCRVQGNPHTPVKSIKALDKEASLPKTDASLADGA